MKKSGWVFIFASTLLAHTAGATGKTWSPWVVRVEKTVVSGIRAGAYPGAALVILRDGKTLLENGFGRTSWNVGAHRVDAAATWYDLASLTKIVGTTTTLLVLVDRGQIKLDDPAALWIPSWRETDKASITVRQLLAHRSGLPADRDLWRIGRTVEERRQAVLDTRLLYAPGGDYVYSDLGADVLGFIIERATGMPLDSAVNKLVLEPLSLSTMLRFKPDLAMLASVAPTENHPPRGYPIQGEVHDENAYALGGVSGHAGLFGTAQGVAAIGELWLNEGELNGVRIADSLTVRSFLASQGDGRDLGWQQCAWTEKSRPSCGTAMSERAYGHTGYTGTALWIDPADRTVFVLLTNRVHGPTAKHSMRILGDVRADLADLASSTEPTIKILRTVAKNGWSNPRPKVAKKHKGAGRRKAKRTRKH